MREDEEDCGWAERSRRPSGGERTEWLEASEGTEVAAAAAAKVERRRLVGGETRWMRAGGVACQDATALQIVVAASIREEAIRADAYETGRQDVQEEAAEKLVRREGDSAGASPVAVVLVREGHALVVGLQQAMVGECDAMGVSGEVGEDALRACEGSLAVDDPVLLEESIDERLESTRISARGVGGWQSQLSSAISALEVREVLGSKDAGESSDRREEAAARGDPGVAFKGETSARDDAVEMGVVGEGLTPGVQESEAAAASAEMGGIGGERTQGFPGAAKEQIVEASGVPEQEDVELFGDCEDEVKVPDREQLRAAGFEPSRRGDALALRAVTIAAGVIYVVRLPAGGTEKDLPAQHFGAAAFNRQHRLTMAWQETVSVLLTIVCAVLTEDIRQF